MTIDNTTIVISCILLLFALTSGLFNVFLKKPKAGLTGKSEPQTDTDTVCRPGFSVVMSVHDNCAEIRKNLPLILSQQYNGEFEVIVVDESSTDDTGDILKQLKSEYPNLYVTFIPASSHYLSRRKLALTLGIKAAKHEWIILTDADCRPAGNMWLESIAEHCDKDADIILGNTVYTHETQSSLRFMRMYEVFSQIKATQNGNACCYTGNNLAIRKSVFFRHNGFLKNLKYLRGEYEYMVNEYATATNTRTDINPEALVIQDEPYRKKWINAQLFHIHTMKHIGRCTAYRLRTATDTAMLHTNTILQLTAAAISAATSQWIVLSAAVSALLLAAAVRTISVKKAARLMGEDFNTFAVPFLYWSMLWRRLRLSITYRMSDKYDFIRK
ncbi:glycosyltransferase [Xylanibacter muris]|uniref:Glycosyltransferase n=1 Tax=Xylanibacter muris TaxID=2736290 RepID=A0ABX2AJR1_9BACT|nr:glycosyltransferase [Xylanibacter muris]NPD91386.1 glycosyltransferase [Xylanibacter muris]